MSRASCDNVKFGGYHVRRHSPDAELTQVGPCTDGGEYLRRFWHPIALADELPSDVPLALRVLGEDLVLFRDLSGRLGLLHRACSHRGASLEYGALTERGIRCCYHGWSYDVDGTILETPADPDNRVRVNVCHGAYPTREHAGLIFAYLGPPDELPELPIYDSWVHPADNELVPFKLHYPCNWLQCHENTADPIHIPFLHGRVSGTRFSPGFAELPALSFTDTPLGMAVASTRFADGQLWIRTADVILPNAAQFPPAFETGERERLVLGAWATRWIVPIDDTHSWVIGYRHFNQRVDPNGQGRKSDVGIEKVDFVAQTAAPEHERQRNPGDYEAMVSQGPIAVHANEHPVASDRGVIALRATLRKGIAAIRERRTLEAPRRDSPAPIPTYTYEAVLPCESPPRLGVLREVGDRVLRILVESADTPPEERQRALAARIREAASWR